MSQHPADMDPQEFFALPVVPLGQYGVQPLRMREDKLGFADPQGGWWVYVDFNGAWHRQQASPLRWMDTGTAATGGSVDVRPAPRRSSPPPPSRKGRRPTLGRKGAR